MGSANGRAYLWYHHYMFGYIAPLKSELKVREFEVYSAYYCAVCRTVKSRYGELPRLMLSYDAAFIAMLGDAICPASDSVLTMDTPATASAHEPELNAPKFNTFRCFNNPLKKRNEVVRTPAIDYAADVLVLLGYCGIKDEKEDGDAGGAFKRAVISGSEALMRNAGQKAAKTIPEQALEVYSCLALQAELEAEKTPELDKAADPTGQFMAKVLDFPSLQGARGSHELSEILQKFGYHLGRFIYIIDVIDDIEKDRLSGAYNPLLINEIPKETLETSLTLDLANMAECFARLPLVYHKTIIENVIFMGLNAVKDEVLANPGGNSRGDRRYLKP